MEDSVEADSVAAQVEKASAAAKDQPLAVEVTVEVAMEVVV